MNENGKELQKLIDRNEIIDEVNGKVTNTDRRNWQGIIDCFADEVVLYYTSLWGGNPTKLKAAEISIRIFSCSGLDFGYPIAFHTKLFVGLFHSVLIRCV